jgi:hypothetical protein
VTKDISHELAAGEAAATSVPSPLSVWLAATRARIDRFIDAEAKRYSTHWARRIAASTALGLLVLVVLHCTVLLALQADSLIQVPVFGGLLVSGFVVTCALLWVYWRARLRPGDMVPYAVGVLIGSLAASVALEAFSAGQLLLWRSGDVHAVRGAGHPGLWQVEQLYGWHLLDSVPLLSVAKTLRLGEPRLFADHLSGMLMLLFKLLVLLPLVGFVVSGYRVAERELGKVRQAKARLAERAKRRTFGDDWEDDISAAAVFFGFLTLGTGLLVWGALNPASPLRDVIADVLPSRVAVAGTTVSFGWLDAWALPVLGAGLICLFAIGALIALAFLTLERQSTRASVRSRTAAVSTALLLTTAVVVGAAVLLIRTGISRPAAGVGDGQVLPTALAFPLWHLLDAIPGLDIPQTLHWRLAHDLDDVWSGVLLLLYKAVLVFGLIYATSRIVQPGSRRGRSADPGALGAVSDFDALAHEAGTHLDRYEQEGLMGRHWPLRREIAALVRRVEGASTDVQALFGSGPVAEHVDRIVELLEIRGSRSFLSRDDGLRARVAADRTAYDREVEAFGTAARRSLAAALASA